MQPSHRTSAQQYLLLTAMLPTQSDASATVSHALAVSTSRAAAAPQTTALRSRSLRLSLFLTRKTPTDAHVWPFGP
jgi:hypothetical protein